MRILVYIIIGVFFGITMYKSEAASWFRIYEMFRFESFHMYGIIGTALIVGTATTYIIKRYNIKSFYGAPIKFIPKDKGFKSYFFGGIIFGLGWALVGACPGPMYTLLGAGFLPIIVVIAAALLGTFLYGLFKEKLPH